MATHHGGTDNLLDKDTAQYGKDTDILNDYHHSDVG